MSSIGPWSTALRGLAGAAVLLTALTVGAADAAPVHRLRISQQPPCAGQPAGMPLIPDDPAALTAPGGQRRCYGIQPPQTELALADGQLVWLRWPASAAAPRIAAGPAPDAPATAAPLPLGLRVVGAPGGVSLETRYGPRATFTPLERGLWQPARAADGSRFWVRVATAEPDEP